MKRFLAWTLALVLALALAGCSGSNVQSMMQGSDDNDDTPAASTPAASTPAASTPAASTPAASTPSEPSGEWIGRKSEDDPAYFKGRIGDRMRNVFFEYTVNSVDYPASYGDITPADGNQLVVADVTVRNVFSQTLPMSIYDFQIQWGDGDEDYGYQEEGLTGDNLMPDQWQLMRGAAETYKLVFQVPADATEFSISYLEVWEDNTQGDVFFVYFEK